MSFSISTEDYGKVQFYLGYIAAALDAAAEQSPNEDFTMFDHAIEMQLELSKLVERYVSHEGRVPDVFLREAGASAAKHDTCFIPDQH